MSARPCSTASIDCAMVPGRKEILWSVLFAQSRQKSTTIPVGSPPASRALTSGMSSGMAMTSVCGVSFRDGAGKGRVVSINPATRQIALGERNRARIETRLAGDGFPLCRKRDNRAGSPRAGMDIFFVPLSFC